jgi:hypothetical protein
VPDQENDSIKDLVEQAPTGVLTSPGWSWTHIELPGLKSARNASFPRIKPMQRREMGLSIDRAAHIFTQKEIPKLRSRVSSPHARENLQDNERDSTCNEGLEDQIRHRGRDSTDHAGNVRIIGIRKRDHSVLKHYDKSSLQENRDPGDMIVL